ncbi:unnamed protein product, partial [Effrenium voratum]
MPLTRRGWIFNNSLKSLRGRRTSSLPWPAPPVTVAGTAVAVAQLDQAKRSADEAKRSADEAFKASPEGKIQQALAKAMEPFEPSRPQDEVIQRPVMEALRQRIASWQQHATIIGGRYQSGKSVATEEALRGARGVVRFTLRSADWTDRMCKHLGVDDEGLFKEVMCRAREKLKGFPDNLTKFPILLLKVPRTTTEGINLISSTAKDVATDKIGSAIHAPQLQCKIPMLQTETHVEGVVSMSDYPL